MALTYNKVFVVCILHVIKHSMDKRKKKPKAEMVQTMERIDIENNIQNEHSNIEKSNLYSRSPSPPQLIISKSHDNVFAPTSTQNDENTTLLNQSA